MEGSCFVCVTRDKCCASNDCDILSPIVNNHPVGVDPLLEVGSEPPNGSAWSINNEPSMLLEHLRDAKPTMSARLYWKIRFPLECDSP